MNTAEVPNYPPPKKEEPPQDPVARSLARPDACAKPAVIGKHTTGVRVRPTNQRMPGRPKRKKRDVRDVKFF